MNVDRGIRIELCHKCNEVPQCYLTMHKNSIIEIYYQCPCCKTKSAVIKGINQKPQAIEAWNQLQRRVQIR